MKYIFIPNKLRENNDAAQDLSLVKARILSQNIMRENKSVNEGSLKAKGDALVMYDVEIPRNAQKYIAVPYVPNGFMNSCSEASAEMILRYYKVVGWSQYEIHRRGYQTFEGNISIGDLGLLNLYRYETFYDKNREPIVFSVQEYNDSNEEVLKNYLNSDIPVLVRYFTDRSDNQKHTVVFIGYDKNGYYYHCNDTGANRYFPNSKFKNDWTKSMIIIQKEALK